MKYLLILLLIFSCSKSEVPNIEASIGKYLKSIYQRNYTNAYRFLSIERKENQSLSDFVGSHREEVNISADQKELLELLYSNAYQNIKILNIKFDDKNAALATVRVEEYLPDIGSLFQSFVSTLSKEEYSQMDQVLLNKRFLNFTREKGVTEGIYYYVREVDYPMIKEGDLWFIR